MAQNALNPTAFQAPTAEQAAATPGYQFALGQGLQALQRNQAATGGLGGAAAKEAEQYGQGLASTNYQQAYSNALGAYGTNQQAAQNALASQSGLFGQNQQLAQNALGNQVGLYGTNLSAAQNALQNQQGLYGTNYNVANQQQNQNFARLAELAGYGQNAANTSMNAALNYGNNAGNLLTSQGNALAAGTMGAANAGAAGTLGLGQALSGAAGTIGSLGQGLYNNYQQKQAVSSLNPGAMPLSSGFSGFNDQIF